MSPISPRRIRVLCVDDSRDLADMLARLIRTQPDMEDAGTLYDAGGIADEVSRRGVDVVVMDLTMPGSPPLDAIRELSRVAPSCRVIAYSGYDDPKTRGAAEQAGARELVSKHSEPADLMNAIRRTAATA